MGFQLDFPWLISNRQREKSDRTKKLLNFATSNEEPPPTPSSKNMAIGISNAFPKALTA